MTTVDADPYPWPYDGRIDPGTTALINIDWQTDFCGPGGYVDTMGYDLSLTRSGLGPDRRRCSRRPATWAGSSSTPARATGPICRTARRTSCGGPSRIGAGIGDEGGCGRILVHGEPGWDIVPEVYPIDGEPIIDKPGKGAFYATDLDLVLRTNGITHIVLTGITTDVCVHTTMREANDRGYECLLLSDCTGATDVGNYEAALDDGDDAGRRLRRRRDVRPAARGRRAMTSTRADHLSGSIAERSFADALDVLADHPPTPARRRIAYDSRRLAHPRRAARRDARRRPDRRRRNRRRRHAAGVAAGAGPVLDRSATRCGPWTRAA